MRVHRSLVLLRQLRQSLQGPALGRILRVESELVAYQRVEAVELVILLLDTLNCSAKIVDGAAQNASVAHIGARLRVAVQLHVHVKAGSYSARKVLHVAKLSENVHRLLGELRLVRENLLIEPVVKWEIVRKTAQERHSGMSVRILESRDYQLAGKVYLAVEAALRDILRACERDLIAVGVKLAGNDILALHGKYFGVVKAYFHIPSEA